MKLKSVLLLAVAMSCGLVAMLGVQQVLSGDNEEKVEDVTKVLVAVVEIGPGARLTEDNVMFKEWPKDAVPDGAITQPEQYAEKSLKVRAYPGEMIMQAKLGTGLGATADIPEGMRVITVAVDQTMTLSGLLLPGNRVDVMVTYKEKVPGRGMVPTIKTVLEYVKVFATDNVRDAAGAESSEIKAKNISLLVHPDEANVLKLAENRGQLHLSLRGEEKNAKQGIANIDDWLYQDNSEDEDQVATNEGAENEVIQEEPQDVETFLDEQAQNVTEEVEPAAEPEKPKWQIEIFRGELKSIEEVELPGETVATATASNAGDSNQKPAPWMGQLKSFLTGPHSKANTEPTEKQPVLTQ